MNQRAREQNSHPDSRLIVIMIFFFQHWVAIQAAPKLNRETGQTKISITLLGQPCEIQGPFSEGTLRQVHAAGPAQIYPAISFRDVNSSKNLIRKAITNLRDMNFLPSLLARYRIRLEKRLEAQLAFFEGIEAEKKTHTSLNLEKAAQQHLNNGALKNFLILLKKIEEDDAGVESQNRAEELFDLYNNGIEKDPEKDFHHAIEALNIHYICSFEGND